MTQVQELYQKIRIADIREEADAFKTLVFENEHSIAYQSGQYLTLVRFDTGEELRRSYSITSSPILNEPLSIGVKRITNGSFSRPLIDDACIGDELVTTGSGGFFVLPQDTQPWKQLFFFAAGSGITPIFSLLKSALYAHPHLSLVLIYSNASVEKTVFLQPLRAFAQQFKDRFHLHLLFSNATDLSKAHLNRDLILSFLQQYSAEKTLFYTCGPESYMRLCKYTLQAAGVPSDRIKKEHFYYADGLKRDAAPPDKKEREVIIKLKDGAYTFAVHYPDSILRAAKKQNILLPYSCEAGRCGSCVARCIKGSVWHSYNEVLTERELAQGLVLTCVGHPNGGDVVLEIE